MRLIEHSVSIFVGALYIYFLIIAFPNDERTFRGEMSNQTWPIQFQFLWYFAILTFMLVTLLSMRHIRKSSESLKEIGIDNNSRQTKIYITFWIIMLIILPTMSALSCELNKDFNKFMDKPKIGLVY